MAHGTATAQHKNQETRLNGSERFQREEAYSRSASASDPVELRSRSGLDRGVFIFFGPVGFTLMSVFSLLIVSHVFNLAPSVLLPSVGAILVVRAIVHVRRDPRVVLPVRPIRKTLSRTLSDEVLFGLLIAALLYFAGYPVRREIAAVFLVTNILFQSVLTISYRLIRKYLAVRLSRIKNETASSRVIIIGTGARARSVADMILETPELDAAIEGFLDFHKDDLWRYRDIPLLGHPDRLKYIIANDQVDAVVLACDRRDIPQTTSLFATTERMGVPFCVVPDLFQHKISRLSVRNLNGLPVLTYRAVPEERISLLLKGLTDRLGALAGLLVLSPLLLLMSAIIKLDSKGPVLFKQERSGVNGKLFTLYKFRTMCADAERRKKQLMDRNEMTGAAFKIRNDPRVTRVGRYLRKFSIDELPQLINVLKGDMSLVGPRPPLPGEVSQYQPWQHRKLSVKPGLTCIWQISGRNDITFEDWMRMDLEYIDNWSLGLDARILLKTIPAVLKGNGAS